MIAADRTSCGEFGIAATAYYLPTTSVAVEDWAKALFKPDAIVRGLAASGCENFLVAAEDETLVTMALAAVSTLFEQNELEPDSIDLIIGVHTLRHSVLAPPLSLPEVIRRHFGCDRARTFTFAHMTCASMFGAMLLCQNLMATDRSLRRVLLVASDKIMDEYARNVADGLVQSDSASAVLLDRDFTRNRVGPVAWHINMQHNPISPSGNRQPGGPGQTGMLNHARVARQAMASVAQIAPGFDLVIEVNHRIEERRNTLKLVGLDPDRLYTANFGRFGHAFCSDFPINLDDALNQIDLAGGNCLAITGGDAGIYLSFAVLDLDPAVTMGKRQQSAVSLSAVQ